MVQWGHTIWRDIQPMGGEGSKEGNGDERVDFSRRNGQHLLKDVGDEYWSSGNF